MKLVVEETETAALQAYLTESRDAVSSEIALTEVVRAVVRQGREAADALPVLAGVEFVSVSRAILNPASALPPPSLRTLDAVHLASALALGPSLSSVVTYDLRMQAAAQDLGLTVEAPG